MTALRSFAIRGVGKTEIYAKRCHFDEQKLRPGQEGEEKSCTICLSRRIRFLLVPRSK